MKFSIKITINILIAKCFAKPTLAKPITEQKAINKKLN